MKMKRFYFWMFLTGLVSSVSLCIAEELLSTPEATWCPNWVSILPSAIASIFLVFWLKCRFKGMLLGLFSPIILLLGHCTIFGTTNILAAAIIEFVRSTHGSIIEFIKSNEFKTILQEILLGIAAEFQTLWQWLSIKLGNMKPPENGIEFIAPFSLMSIALIILAGWLIVDFFMGLKKSTTKK